MATVKSMSDRVAYAINGFNGDGFSLTQIKDEYESLGRNNLSFDDDAKAYTLAYLTLLIQRKILRQSAGKYFPAEHV